MVRVEFSIQNQSRLFHLKYESTLSSAIFPDLKYITKSFNNIKIHNFHKTTQEEANQSLFKFHDQSISS